MKRQRQRQHRVAKAIAFLRIRPSASALEIGDAATEGERRSRHMTWRAKEAIGLEIAASLVEQGFARATRGNMFQIARQ
jgi:hypothetical protein